MAFQTLPGENGTDYLGTDNVDALFVLNDNSGKILVDALGGGDNVDLTNETGVVGNAEVKLGDGADTFTTGANDTNNNRLKDSTVNGGPGNDDITTEGAIGTKLRGNEGDDDFFLLSNYTNTTINGNDGQDSFTITQGQTITLSDSKILGGSGNDGQMDFSNTNGSILAVDSVIQGGKGLDTITIGNLTAGLSNFRVSGGADNDTINVNNATGGADGAEYNGADGEDSISFGNTNAADAVSKGGNGNDRYTISGSGAISAAGEAGDDVFAISGGQNNGVNLANARNTIIGGEGADTYSHSNAASRRGQTYRVNAVSESAAATTGTAVTFDTFNNTLSTTKTNGGDILDLASGGTAEALVGNRLNGDQVQLNDAAGVEVLVGQFDNADLVTGAEISVTTFAALKTALDGNLVQSTSNLGDADVNTGRISFQVVIVDGGTADVVDGIDGTYAILNNTNNILDSGDMMFSLAGNGVAVLGATTTGTVAIDGMVAAIEAGF